MLRDAPKVDEVTPAQHERYERVTDAIYELGMSSLAPTERSPVSLAEVASGAGIPSREVLRLVGRAFRRRGRRWELRGPEQWPRGLDMIVRQGFVQTTVRSPTTAARVREHYDAIRLLLKSHDASALRALEGKFIIDGYGIRRYFCTDPLMILWVIRVHHLRIESMNGHWAFTEFEQ
jgi:hypothetical protein